MLWQSGSAPIGVAGADVDDPTDLLVLNTKFFNFIVPVTPEVSDTDKVVCIKTYIPWRSSI
jgi:hypothetical protein